MIHFIQGEEVSQVNQQTQRRNMTCCTEGGAEEEVKLPLLTGVGDGHGDALFKHHSTFSPRVLGALLQVPVPAVGPVPLMVACTHQQTLKKTTHIHCLIRFPLTSPSHGCLHTPTDIKDSDPYTLHGQVLSGHVMGNSSRCQHTAMPRHAI